MFASGQLGPAGDFWGHYEALRQSETQWDTEIKQACRCEILIGEMDRKTYRSISELGFGTFLVPAVSIFCIEKCHSVSVFRYFPKTGHLPSVFRYCIWVLQKKTYRYESLHWPKSAGALTPRGLWPTNPKGDSDPPPCYVHGEVLCNLNAVVRRMIHLRLSPGGRKGRQKHHLIPSTAS